MIVVWLNLRWSWLHTVESVGETAWRSDLLCKFAKRVRGCGRVRKQTALFDCAWAAKSGQCACAKSSAPKQSDQNNFGVRQSLSRRQSVNCRFCNTFKMNASKKIAGYMSRRRHDVLEKMLRVNHAGELGADRIYHGQTFVLHNDAKNGPLVQNMWDQEKAHLEEMEYLNLKYRTRKSMLEPFWSIGGFLLGATTATLSPKSAMACTVAVERVITQHYNDQIREIVHEGDQQKLGYVLDKFCKFRDDEQHHHDTARENEGTGQDTQRLNAAVDLVCRASIKIAERV